MKQFPWKATGIGCAIVTVLVLIRCLVTVGRVLYYGGTYWHNLLIQDPWFYVGMAAAVLCVASFVMLAIWDKEDDTPCQA